MNYHYETLLRGPLLGFRWGCHQEPKLAALVVADARQSIQPASEDLYIRCQRILEEVESLEAAVEESRNGPRGTLRIDVPVASGRQIVLPVLMKLMANAPELKVDVRFSDHVVDVIKEGVDAEVRIGPLADSCLVGRMFDQQVLSTCASPAYLAKHPAPESPNELSKHICLLFRMPSSGRSRPWQFRFDDRDYSLLHESGIQLGDGDALVQAAAAGLGLIQVPKYIVESEVKHGKLVEILQLYRPAPLPISLVYPSHRHIPLRVLALADALVKR